MEIVKRIFRSILKLLKWLFGKRIRAVIVIIVLFIIGYFGYKNYSDQQKQPNFQTSQAEKGTLVTNVTASGTISSGNSVNITTQSSGIINNVYVKNGDSVTQGQKIADVTLDRDSQQRQAAAWANYQSSLTSVKNAQNTQRSAQATLEKVLDDIHLFQYGNGGFSNIGSANETETQRSDRTMAQVSADKAYDAFNLAQVQIASTWLSYLQSSSTITAPSSGVVSNLIITPGLQVSGGTSTSNSSTVSSQKIGSIKISEGQIQSTVNLSEVDAIKVQPGQKVTLTLDAFPDKTFTGKVLAIDTNGSVSSGVTTYPATISIDSAPSDIFPNMGVTAKIITNAKNDVVLVPSAAVQNINGQKTVRVMTGNQLTNVTVETGDSNDTQTEITSGINDGDTVVTGQTTNAARTGTTSTSPFGAIGGRGGFGGFGGGGGARGR